jgi:hypothetical protein
MVAARVVHLTLNLSASFHYEPESRAIGFSAPVFSNAAGNLDKDPGNRLKATHDGHHRVLQHVETIGREGRPP